MRSFLTLPAFPFRRSVSQCVMLSAGLLVAPSLSPAQAPGNQPSNATAQTASAHPHHRAKKKPAPEPVAETPPPPPTPHWPANDQPTPASVVWNADGLHINASNSSLQQILSEVSTETGSKIEGPVPDQRVYGNYGPGQARDVLSELLQGSGYNVILAGDLGKGAPRDIVLTPRLAGGTNAQNAGMSRPQQDTEDEAPEPPEEQPAPPAQPQQMPGRPGFGPNGPIRTPQQIMEEMQQRQQQQQQQQQQTAPQQNPQQ
jgi:hypothetical protein